MGSKDLDGVSVGVHVSVGVGVGAEGGPGASEVDLFFD